MLVIPMELSTPAFVSGVTSYFTKRRAGYNYATSLEARDGHAVHLYRRMRVTMAKGPTKAPQRPSSQNTTPNSTDTIAPSTEDSESNSKSGNTSDLAEETRRALSSSKPLVKFRKDTDFADEEHSGFAYTSGVKGGVDVWLITGILFFVVPFIVFGVYVLNGTIDLAPR